MKYWWKYVLLIAILIVIIVVCYKWYQSKAGSTPADVPIVAVDSTSKDSIAITPAVNVDPSAIIGSWADGHTNYDNIAFTQDSIIYQQFNKKYAYSISGDSIFIALSDMTLRGKMLIYNDTLNIISDDGGMLLWRKK
jgi:uncharacterized protein YpmS